MYMERKGTDMSFREYYENLEKQILAPHAMKSADTKGRRVHMIACDLRTEFQRDRDRIIHCKSFRRLKHKTQVFLSPEGDHYRTRLTHTLEVSQIARTISRALRLNEDLTEAIALGHDLGHTPFGHAGERVLDKIAGGFEHNLQSLRMVDVLENLNLTYEVRDGIKNHKKGMVPETLEGMVVNYSDRIAYINHDIDDALRAGIIRMKEIPQTCLDGLGRTHGKRIDTMIRDIVYTSMDGSGIRMSPEAEALTDCLRRFMYDNVYIGSDAKAEEKKAEKVIEMLYAHFMEHSELLPQEHIGQAVDTRQAVVDYIAGMTDRFALKVFETLYLPKGWQRY
jgi:dGTPase